jgi:hypothetical protein
MSSGQSRHQSSNLEIRSASGASRPDLDSLAGVKRPGHSATGVLGSEPDDSVPDVVELRCAGLSGPGRREHVGCGGDPSGGGEGEGGIGQEIWHRSAAG